MLLPCLSLLSCLDHRIPWPSSLAGQGVWRAEQLHGSSPDVLGLHEQEENNHFSLGKSKGFLRDSAVTVTVL